MGNKKMITPQEFAERVGRPYQTVMYWLRQKLIPGAEMVQESRGPAYSVPEDQVEAFKKQGPKRGRPAKPKPVESKKVVSVAPRKLGLKKPSKKTLIAKPNSSRTR